MKRRTVAERKGETTTGQESQEIRRAMNEAVYRTAGRDAGEETLFFCECGDGGCVERVPLRLEEYESVRQHEASHVVADGHAGARLVT